MGREESAAKPTRTVTIVLGAFAAAFAITVFAIAPQVPFVIFAGVLLALFVRLPSVWLATKMHLSYRVTATIVWLFLFGVAALTVLAIGQDVVEQVKLLSSRLPTFAHRIVQQLRNPPGWIREFMDHPTANNLRAEPGAVMSSATDVAIGVTGLLGALVVVFFIGLYASLAPGTYARVVVALAPKDEQKRVERVLHDVADTLGRWLVGRLVAMAFVGVFTAIGLALLGVPISLGLGVIAGLLTFIEYLGALVSAVPAVLLALTLSPLHVVWVSLLYLGVHIVEGYLLTPFIARKAVEFPPAYTLASQLVLGGLFGVLGLTFATPMTVVLVIVVKAILAGRERPGT